MEIRKKYKMYLPNGTEVKFGDIVRKTSKYHKNGINKEEIMEFTFTPEIAFEMHNRGELKLVEIPKKRKCCKVYDKVNTKKEPNSVKNYNDEISKLYEKAYSAVKEKYNFGTENLRNIINYNPSAFFSMMLKEIAFILDLNYAGTINQCKEVFVISSLSGKIVSVNRKAIKNFKNFAAFRTIEDVKKAKSALRVVLKQMYDPVKKQENNRS